MCNQNVGEYAARGVCCTWCYKKPEKLTERGDERHISHSSNALERILIEADR